jgi:hypothetical protein
MVKPACEQKLGATQAKVSTFAADRPAWMDVVKPPAGAPVYVMSPGAAVYRHVCINCHGPNADGKGLQVDLLAAASEGEARPANFRDGLFGPATDPVANLKGTFDVGRAGNLATAALWGSRYMAWMALGGTLKRIPQDIIQLVAATPIMGNLRPNLNTIPGATDATGNMLNVAKGFCALILPSPIDKVYAFENNSLIDNPTYPPYNHAGSPLIDENYDKEMWLHFCTDFSPQVVRVYGALSGASGSKQAIQLLALYYAQDPSNPGRSYPATAPVWDQAKRVQVGVRADNLYPACLDPALIPPATLSNIRMPPCPTDFLTNGKVMWRHVGLSIRFPGDDQEAFRDNVEAWKLRGGIATGMAVFSYLQQRVTDPSLSRMPPYYDQCELLP